MNSQTLMTLWAAFCTSNLMFGGVSYVAWPGRSDEQLVIWVLAGMVAPMTLMSVFGASLIAKGQQPTQQILRFAFAESIAVFGVVCSLLGGPIWIGPAMAGWAFLLVLIAFPRQET